MADNFCFTFYPGEYLRDTQCLSERSQVAYDRIMCEHMRNICISQQQLNFFTKKLSEEEKEELLTILTKKDDGYMIRWVAESISKKRAYSQSRSENRKGKKKKTHEEHMISYENHMVNVYVNKEENIEEIEDRKEDRRGCKGEEGEKEEGREEGKKSLYVIPEMWATWKRARPGYPADQSLDFEPLQKIGAFISKQEGIPWIPQNRTEIDQILTIWLGIGEFIHSDGFFSKYSLKQVSSHIQSICQSYAKKQSSSSGNFDEEFDRAFAKMRGQ